MIANWAVKNAFNKNHYNMEQTLDIKFFVVVANIDPIVDNRIWLANNLELKKYQHDSKSKNCTPKEFF